MGTRHEKGLYPNHHIPYHSTFEVKPSSGSSEVHPSWPPSDKPWFIGPQTRSSKTWPRRSPSWLRIAWRFQDKEQGNWYCWVHTRHKETWSHSQDPCQQVWCI